MSNDTQKFTPPWYLKYIAAVLVWAGTFVWWMAETPTMADVRHEISVTTEPFAKSAAKYDNDRELWTRQLTTISVQLATIQTQITAINSRLDREGR